MCAYSCMCMCVRVRACPITVCLAVVLCALPSPLLAAAHKENCWRLLGFPRSPPEYKTLTHSVLQVYPQHNIHLFPACVYLHLSHLPSNSATARHNTLTCEHKTEWENCEKECCFQCMRSSLIQYHMTKYLATEIYTYVWPCVCLFPICRMLLNIPRCVCSFVTNWAFLKNCWPEIGAGKKKNVQVQPRILLFLFSSFIEKDNKNRWMGFFTHHNRNLRFKRCGGRSGFPGKTYRPHLVESFHPQRLAEQYRGCMCLFVAWVAPVGIKPIIIVSLLKLRSVYTHY